MMAAWGKAATAAFVAASAAATAQAPPTPISPNPTPVADQLPREWQFLTNDLIDDEAPRLNALVSTLSPADRAAFTGWLTALEPDMRTLIVDRWMASGPDTGLRFPRLMRQLSAEERNWLRESLSTTALTTQMARIDHLFDLMKSRSDDHILTELKTLWKVDNRLWDFHGDTPEEQLREAEEIERAEQALDPDFVIFRRTLPMVTGGDFTTLKEAPYQVEIFRTGASATPLSQKERRIEIRNYGRSLETYERWHQCGGVLIAPQWVITAAHCILDPPKGPYLDNRRVRTGADNIEHGGTTWKITAVVKHGGYDNDLKVNDIALLKIAADAETKPRDARGAVPAVLASISDPPLKVGEPLIVTGFGATGVVPVGELDNKAFRNPEPSSSQLMRGEVQYMTHETCNGHAMFKAAKRAISWGQICARGKGTTDACQGDSGGPLTRNRNGRKMVIGLVSYGFGCGTEDFPGVYVDVRAYRSWIEGAKAAAKEGHIVNWAPTRGGNPDGR